MNVISFGAADRVAVRQQWVRLAAVRSVAGVRRLLGNFIRTVHPDLTSSFPEEARRINQRSLAELNAFVDRLELERAPLRLEDGPEAARELAFFRGHQTRTGRVLPGRVLPLVLPLPSLPVAADEEQREYVAARLVRDAEVVLSKSSSAFSDRPTVPPLFTQKGAGRAAFDRLWWQQTRDEMFREALFGPDDSEVRRQIAMRVFAAKYECQLVRRYTRIRSGQRRSRKLAAVSTKVEAKVQNRFEQTESSRGQPHAEDETFSESSSGLKDQQRVLQSGFHPDLVFVAPDLDGEKRREAIRRVCGMNLVSEADVWLLENLWKAMRGTTPPVPLVIAARSGHYAAHEDMGFIQVPWDFTVLGLCDLLEEHLESVRAGLTRRRARSSDAELLPPPATLTGEPEPTEDSDGTSDDEGEDEESLS